MKKIIVILFITFSSAYSTYSQNTPRSLDSLTEELNEVYKIGAINGYSLAIVNEKKVLYQKGYGYSDKLNKKEYTPETIQNIASVSKTLIGIALLKAQEQGKLNLDDPINNYLPFKVINPYYPKNVITIRHLTTHTSSIKDTQFYDKNAYVLNNEDLNSKALKKTSEKFNHPDTKIAIGNFLLKLLSENGKWYKKSNFIKKEPGSEFSYSNIGATLAAYIIEVATGEPYDVFTTKHILKPLGMNSSGWKHITVDASKYSTLYADLNTPLPKYSLITYPDGGLITSMNDFCKYLIELIKGYSENGTLLNQQSYKELFTKQLSGSHFKKRDPENPYNDEYNTGIFMGLSAKGYIGHTGGDPGVATFMFFNPETKIGKILMINTSISSSSGVIDQFIKTWYTMEKYEELINK